MIITIQLLRVEFMSILPTYKCVETTKDYGTTKSRVALNIFFFWLLFSLFVFSENKLLFATPSKSENIQQL